MFKLGDLVYAKLHCGTLYLQAFRGVAGAMAGGIASAEIVIAMAKAGLLGFFGAGGLPIAAVRENVARIKREVSSEPVGCNLLHNPAEPAVEEQTVDIYLKANVQCWNEIGVGLLASH